MINVLNSKKQIIMKTKILTLLLTILSICSVNAASYRNVITCNKWYVTNDTLYIESTPVLKYIYTDQTLESGPWYQFYWVKTIVVGDSVTDLPFGSLNFYRPSTSANSNLRSIVWNAINCSNKTEYSCKLFPNLQSITLGKNVTKFPSILKEVGYTTG